MCVCVCVCVCVCLCVCWGVGIHVKRLGRNKGGKGGGFLSECTFSILSRENTECKNPKVVKKKKKMEG